MVFHGFGCLFVGNPLVPCPPGWRQRAEGKGQEAENRKQRVRKARGGGQESEGKRQTAERRGQEADGKRQGEREHAADSEDWGPKDLRTKGPDAQCDQEGVPQTN